MGRLAAALVVVLALGGCFGGAEPAPQGGGSIVERSLPPLPGEGMAGPHAPDVPEMTGRPERLNDPEAPSSEESVAPGVEGQAMADAAVAEPGPVAEPPALPPALRAEQRACERGGGRLVARSASRGSYVCQQSTRDAGRSCTARGQCTGECLARSGTCAPVTPLYGCHEVLGRAGERTTLCLE